MLGMLPPDGGITSNFEFLHLMFITRIFDNEIVWLIGVYMQFVWNNVTSKNKSLSPQIIKTECELKFASQHEANMPTLAHICGLF